MRLFDLHCDTLTELRDSRETIHRNGKQVSLEKAFPMLSEYRQILAVWSKKGLSDEENYRLFDVTLDRFEAAYIPDGRFRYRYGVEDASLLAGKLGRMEHLAERGVKILTLTWSGVTAVGGAWDTDVGLTDFGKAVVNACYDLGITPDLSHASDAVFRDTVGIAGKRNGTVMCSHSDLRELCPHRRNLTGDMAREVAALGGVVGVTLVTPFLGGSSPEDVLRHIYALAGKMGEQRVCLGCDYDGTDELPAGMEDLSGIGVLHDLLTKQVGNDFADRIFYENARQFEIKNWE